jgi:hypothetical protein
MGRPRKPAAQHQAEGTYRKDRHADAVTIPDQGALSVVPGANVPEAVHAEYSMTVSRFRDYMVDADVPLLEIGFTLLDDSRYYHGLVDRVKANLDELEGADVTEAVKVLVSLGNMYLKTVDKFAAIVGKYGVTPSERAKILHLIPKRKDDSAKKSIRSVIARKP